MCRYNINKPDSWVIHESCMEYVYCIFICIHRVDSNVIIAIIVHMHPGIYYIWTTDFNHYYMHACKICAGTAVPMQKHRTYICWIQQQDAKHKPLQKNHASIAISVNFYDLWDCKLQTIICSNQYHWHPPPLSPSYRLLHGHAVPPSYPLVSTNRVPAGCGDYVFPILLTS